ncbi:hypothetical protein OQA88_8059 [Cercophora sp. LCS_1]
MACFSLLLRLVASAVVVAGSPVPLESGCRVREQLPFYHHCPGSIAPFLHLGGPPSQWLEPEDVAECVLVPQEQFVVECSKDDDHASEDTTEEPTIAVRSSGDDDVSFAPLISKIPEEKPYDKDVSNYALDVPVDKSVVLRWRLAVKLPETGQVWTWFNHHKIADRDQRQDFSEIVRLKSRSTNYVGIYNVSFSYFPPASTDKSIPVFGTIETTNVHRLDNKRGFDRAAVPSAIPTVQIARRSTVWPPTFSNPISDDVARDAPIAGPMSLEQRVAYLEKNGVPSRPHYVPSESHPWVYVYTQKEWAPWPSSLFDASSSDLLRYATQAPITTEPTLWEPPVTSPQDTNHPNYASPFDMSEMAQHEGVTVWIVFLVFPLIMCIALAMDVMNKWRTGEMQEELWAAWGVLTCCFPRSPRGPAIAPVMHHHKAAQVMHQPAPVAQPDLEKGGMYVSESSVGGGKGKEVSPVITTIEEEKGTGAEITPVKTKTAGGGPYGGYERGSFAPTLNDASSAETAVAPTTTTTTTTAGHGSGGHGNGVGIGIGIGLTTGSSPASGTTGSPFFHNVGGERSGSGGRRESGNDSGGGGGEDK